MTWHYETDCEETPKREKSNDESKGEDLNNKNNSSSILLNLKVVKFPVLIEVFKSILWPESFDSFHSLFDLILFNKTEKKCVHILWEGHKI